MFFWYQSRDSLVKSSPWLAFSHPTAKDEFYIFLKINLCYLLIFIFCSFLKGFMMATIFKVFIEFVTILLMSYDSGFFGPEACGILAPDQGFNPYLLHWKSKS